MMRVHNPGGVGECHYIKYANKIGISVLLRFEE